jgi:UDP-glucuronate 4-epimerase
VNRYLVTGAAGFIGANVAQALLDAGCDVVGVDSLNDYYDVGLKHYRLKPLLDHSDFSFVQGDLADTQIVDSLFARHDFDCVIHLAAQAGVRYSLENPGAYIQSNILGFQHLIDACRAKPPAHFVFASSSSVYGNSDREWFSESDPTDTPVSLYAATKKSNEMIAHTYAHLHGLPATGLRFFTVYGPAGRPDMAYFGFTKAIVEGTPIQVFNDGQLERDFTYIDDIVSGVVAAAAAPPVELEVPYRLLNLGNHQPVKLGDFIATLEGLLGKEANKQLVGMQPGDVYRTAANIDAAKALVGFEPSTELATGLERFVAWYRNYYGV